MPRVQPHSPRRGLKIAGLVGFIVMMIGGAAAMSIASMKPPVDEATLCRRDIPLELSKLIIVDTTDPLTRNQLSQLRAAIIRARDSLPVYGKLTLLFLDAGSPYEPREIFSMCNPGSSANSNPLFVTASRMDKRWKDSFGQPLDDTIAWLKSAPTAEASPLMETIAAATQRPDFDARIPKKELIVVSDLLQHQPGGYTQYQQGDLWAAYKRSRLPIETRPDLTDVTIDIIYLTRPQVAQFQTPRHRAFWRRWLNQAGAASVHFIGIPNDDEMALQNADGNVVRQNGAQKRSKAVHIGTPIKATPKLAHSD